MQLSWKICSQTPCSSHNMCLFPFHNLVHHVIYFFFYYQDDIPAMLTYAFKVCMSLIQHRQFRNTILGVLTKLYMGLHVPDYINVCQVCFCVFFL